MARSLSSFASASTQCRLSSWKAVLFSSPGVLRLRKRRSRPRPPFGPFRGRCDARHTPLKAADHRKMQRRFSRAVPRRKRTGLEENCNANRLQGCRRWAERSEPHQIGYFLSRLSNVSEASLRRKRWRPRQRFPAFHRRPSFRRTKKRGAERHRKTGELKKRRQPCCGHRSGS